MSPCAPTTMSGFLLVSLVISGVSLAVSMCLVTFMCRLKKTSTTWKDLKFGPRGVTVCREEDGFKYSYCRFLMTFLLCFRPTESYCVDPHSSHEISGGSTYNYRLRVGQEACFENGSVEHVTNRESYSIDYLYTTSEWKEKVWKMNGCGNGAYCGNSGDCGEWGSQGQVVQSRDTTYLKSCRSYSVNFFSCASYWACWVSTLEVQHGEYPPFFVFSIGESESSNFFRKNGNLSCEITMTSHNPTLLYGKYLVTNREDDAWVCSTASEHLLPTPGTLGDLQMIKGKAIFNFGAFVCDMESSSSNGNCKVVESFIARLGQRCTKLPLLVDGGSLHYHSGKLEMDNSGYDDFRIQFTQGAHIRHSQHACFMRVALLTGHKGDRGMYMYIFSAQSTDNQSTWLVHSECLDTPLEVLCDGTQTAYHIAHADDNPCKFDGVPAIDSRGEDGEINWHWSEGDHHDRLAEYHLSKWGTIVLLVAVLLLILRCLRF